MSKVRVQSFAISIDGYGAGPRQDLQHPLGLNGPELMEWLFHTRMWQRMYGQGNGEGLLPLYPTELRLFLAAGCILRTLTRRPCECLCLIDDASSPRVHVGSGGRVSNPLSGSHSPLC